MLEPNGDFHRHDGRIIPAQPHLGRQRDVRNGVFDRFHEVVKEGRAAKEARAGVLLDDFMGRAAKIEVKEVRADPIADLPGSLGHRGRGRPEDLDPHGTLSFREVDHLPGLGVTTDESFRLDELADHDVRPLLFT